MEPVARRQRPRLGEERWQTSWQSALTKTLDTSYDRAQSEGLEWALRDEHLAKFDQMTRGR